MCHDWPVNPLIPISTYKISKLISIHFLTELIERICSKIKAFSLRWSLILLTFSLDCVSILWGENWYWSLLGLKGLKCHWFDNPLGGKFKMHFWAPFNFSQSTALESVCISVVLQKSGQLQYSQTSIIWTSIIWTCFPGFLFHEYIKIRCDLEKLKQL